MARNISPAEKINATYRVQLHKEYTIYNLLEYLDYIHDLGVTHLYLSPVFESVKGSNHGYDMTNPFEVSSERGGEEALAELDRCLASYKPQMKIILDIVPNHMAATGENVLWYDVLKRGRGSPYWKVFDIHIGKGEKINLPVLGDPLEDVLKKGEFSLRQNADKGWEFSYYDHFFPVSEKSACKAHGEMSRNEIADLLDEQFYAPVFWQDIFEKVDYRRFFDIADLVGVRMEDPEVFDLMHSKLFEIFDKYPSLAGVRTDHIDGMKYPAKYLENLSEKIPLIWVEKILAPDEEIPENWPVAGTTGYEFTEKLNHLLINETGFKILEDAWRSRTRSPWRDFERCVNMSKKEILPMLFNPELERLTGYEEDRHFWIESSAAIPVYRTYVTEENYSDKDRFYIEETARKLGGGKAFGRLNPEDPDNRQKIVQWQQLTGPAMAKGLEDTAHYRYTPLACLNEVGCEAAIRPSSLQMFCHWLNSHTKKYPLTMKSSTTHDTKRAEDVRARLMTLADMPAEWLSFTKAASEANSHLLTQVNGIFKPAEAAVHLFLQTTIGVWLPGEDINDSIRERIVNYMIKASREAKLETNWLSPDPGYEKALENYVLGALSNEAFLEMTGKFVSRIARFSALNSLAVLTMKIISPGVPDIYQGTELWNFSLVDPDNRRPVDYGLRKKIAEKQCNNFSLKKLAEEWQNGEIKMWLTKRLLEIRKEYLLDNIDNLVIKSLESDGEKSANVIAYSIAPSEKPEQTLMVVLPARPSGLAEKTPLSLLIPPQEWGETAISIPPSMKDQKIKDMITGREIECAGSKISVAYVFQNFPVAVFSVL